MIRESLLESDRFLNLPDNTARICYIALLLTADDRGNLEASSGRLVRLWRDFGVDSNQKAASISQFLADQDLIRLYEADEKNFIHVPRFNQRLRHLKTACPSSPWCKDTEKQSGAQKNDRRPTDDRPTTDGQKRREEKRREEKKLIARSRADARSAHPIGDGDLVAELPSRNGPVPVHRSFVMELIDAYPAVMVGQEIDRAKLWLEANPAKQKSNIRRYLTNWMARQQERGGSR